jgi:ubiquinone/menaquinone biosynthesis C-methylase UbiE
MSHRFDPRHLNILDNPLRLLATRPRSALRRLGVGSGDRVIDIGAGSGFFSLPAALLVGSEGEVLAVDIAPEAVALIEKKRLEKGVGNLRALLSTEASLGLPAGRGTFALMFKVFHEVDDKAAMLKELYGALKPGGRIAIVEFNRGTAFGPPLEVRVPRERARALLEGAGFVGASTERWSGSLYVARAVKAPGA